MNTHEIADDPAVKASVAEFWERASCGEVYAEGPTLRQQLDAHARARYALEPYIFDFARFGEGRDRDVLEIGVGMGADHLQWARARPRSLTGIDLTSRAVQFTQTRLALEGFTADVRVGDAERLPLDDASVDIVYSWGVLHHSPNTPQAVREVHRVLRPGGTARVMVYHRRSLVGAMLWIRYALLRGRPFRSLDSVYSEHLESPGTKAYSRAQARALFAQFATVRLDIRLSNGDLLEGAAGQRHRGPLLAAARRLWPRSLIRRFAPNWGLFLLIEAVK
jgi:SAM-dependent methyltransferase